jgi:hypothetical protein
MTRRGAIFAEEAYAQGKMLENSSWNSVLPRGITPSDTDMVFDNLGAIIHGELSSAVKEWTALARGQRWTYQSKIKHNACHCAVLAHHNVKPEYGCKIDTLRDILTFQVMVFFWCDFRVSRIIEGAHWQKFVTSWFRNPDGLRGEVFERGTTIPQEA